MKLDDETRTRLIFDAVRELVVHCRQSGRRVPEGYGALLTELEFQLISADGSRKPGDETELGRSAELIDTTEVATILGCTTRRVRQISTDLDGRRIGGIWLFDRKTVTEYADQKGEHVPRQPDQ